VTRTNPQENMIGMASPIKGRKTTELISSFQAALAGTHSEVITGKNTTKTVVATKENGREREGEVREAKRRRK